MIQDDRKYNVSLFDSCLCLEKRHFEDVGGKINLSDGQTQIAAHSFPDLT